MLDAFEQACAELGYPHVHLERFTPPEQMATKESDSYTVALKNTGLTLKIEPGQSLLDAILNAGIAVIWR